VPLVLADVPPLNELLVHGCGVGVPPKDPGALAEATIRLLDDQAAAQKLGRAGQAAVRDIYSAEAMARAVEKIYSEVLEP